MTPERYLVVNADDFGQTDGINRGIIIAHEEGIVTSASLMVRWPAAPAAAAYARTHPELSVGLHVDLGEWTIRDGSWVRLYEVLPDGDPLATREEIAQQLRTFRSLVGKNPTHIDSHQHVHRDEPVRSFVQEISHALKIPERHFVSNVHYCGGFYGQSEEGEPFPEGVSLDNLERIVRTLPHGITELSCHPGSLADSQLNTQYLHERAEETKVLCDPRLPKMLEATQATLCSFREVPWIEQSPL